MISRGMPLVSRLARWFGALTGALLLVWGVGALAAPPSDAASVSPTSTREYLLSPDDVIHIAVFQNPDLTLDARIDERGNIAYPLVGSVHVGGGSVIGAENAITKALRDGGFLVSPQVRVSVVQVRGSQITVLGHVAHPGRYSLDSPDLRVSDMIALAGGVATDGADIVVLTGSREGKPVRREINIRALGHLSTGADNITVRPGDMLFVDRAPTFFIYGEVQRPGVYRLEDGMTVMQALATGGGLTPKGTQRGLAIHRKSEDGKVEVIQPKLDDPVRDNDVLNIRESLF